MNQSQLLQLRLTNQRLTMPHAGAPAETVSWLGAVQSQEFSGARWSLAQRHCDLTDAAFNAAFATGAILRTHVLRPTWHFVAAADIRWMLALTAPRIRSFMKYNSRQLGLDEALYAQSNALLHRALEDGQHLTRLELADVLKLAGLRLAPNALVHLLMRAELDGILCSGALRGQQHTYALLDQRAPDASLLPRDEALAELARRYFTSHGPATLQDFSWWSGLTLTDARAGLGMVKSQLTQTTLNRITYWYADLAESVQPAPKALLLPNFDEYVVAYTDRAILLEPAYEGPLRARGQMLTCQTVVLNGQVIGTWTVSGKKPASPVTVETFRTLTGDESCLIEQAIQHYQTFREQKASHVTETGPASAARKSAN